jgi:hypothetical protein
MIHENFYCNRRYAAATSLTAGGLAAQSVNILFQVCLPPSRLRAPVSRGVSVVSSRTLVNNAGRFLRSGHGDRRMTDYVLNRLVEAGNAVVESNIIWM